MTEIEDLFLFISELTMEEFNIVMMVEMEEWKIKEG